MPISQCPECEMPMEAKNFEDVLIDSCPSCRGVWLDRGELQKIIAHVRRQEAEEPSGSLEPTAAAPPPSPSADVRAGKIDRKKKKKKFGLWDALEDLIDL